MERVALVLATLITRVIFRSERLYDLDSVNFALALSDFDPWLHQPHPPGYYLYVLSGRLASFVFPEANDALVAVSVVASCVTVLALYELARAMYGGRAGLYAGIAFVLSPLGWFHGTVALTYIAEAAGSATVGWLCWRTRRGDPKTAVWAAAALAVTVGMRQSAILFLGPLWLFCLYRRSAREIVRAVVVFGCVCLAWFAPMIIEAGGPERYFAALSNLWTAVPAQKALTQEDGIGGAAALGAARLLTIGFIFLITIGFFGVARLLRVAAPSPEPGRTSFILVWLGPGIAFFSIVYLIFVNSGYLLVITPPLFAWVGGVLDRFVGQSRPSASVALTLSGAAALNICVFLWAPFYFSHSSVEDFERRLDQVVTSMHDRLSSRETLIVAFDAHFHGFRHAGYYLPEFQTIAYPATRFPDGEGIYSIQDRQTRQLDRLPSGYKKVAFFPLPDGVRYEEYLAENVIEKLGDAATEYLSVGDTRVLVIGREALERLFEDDVE